MKPLFIPVAVLAALVVSVAASPKGAAAKTSGVYLTTSDYKLGRVSFEGDCGEKTHKLELHDVLHKSYIHVTHGTEKRRFEKKDIFGFRACDGYDYRFSSNLEYRILEAKELYIYTHDVYVSHGRGRHTVRGHFFSVGPDNSILALTLQNLKQAVSGNQQFHDKLDATFGTGRKLEEYDEAHGTFTVNRLLAASHERTN